MLARASIIIFMLPEQEGEKGKDVHEPAVL